MDPFQLGASESSGSGGGGLGGLASGLLGMIPGLGGLFGGGGSKQSQQQSQSQSQTQANQQTMNFIQANPGPADALGALASPLPAMFPQLGSAPNLNLGSGFQPMPGAQFPHAGGAAGGYGGGYGAPTAGGMPIAPLAAMLSARGYGAPAASPGGVQIPVSSEGGGPLFESAPGGPQYEGPGRSNPAYAPAMMPSMPGMQVGGGSPMAGMNSPEGGFVPPPPPMLPDAQAMQQLQSAANGGAAIAGLPSVPKLAPPPASKQQTLGAPRLSKLDMQQMHAQRDAMLQQRKADIDAYFGPDMDRLQSEFDESQQAVAEDRNQVAHAEHMFLNSGARGYDLAKSQVLGEREGTNQHPVANRVARGLAGFLTSNRPFAAALEQTPMYDQEMINSRGAVYAEKFQTQAERIHKDAIEMLRSDAQRMRSVGGQLAATRSRMAAAQHQAALEVYRQFGQDLNTLGKADSEDARFAQVNNTAAMNDHTEWYQGQKLNLAQADEGLKRFGAETSRMNTGVAAGRLGVSQENAETGRQNMETRKKTGEAYVKSVDNSIQNNSGAKNIQMLAAAMKSADSAGVNDPGLKTRFYQAVGSVPKNLSSKDLQFLYSRAKDDPNADNNLSHYGIDLATLKEIFE